MKMKWADNILLTAQEIDGRTLHVPNRARTTVTIVWNFGVLWRVLAEKKQFYYQIYIGILSNMVWNARIIFDYRNLSAYNLIQVWSKPIFQFSRKLLIFSIYIYIFKLSSFTRLKPFLILRHPVVIVMRNYVMLEIHNSWYCCFSKMYCGFRSLQLFD